MTTKHNKNKGSIKNLKSPLLSLSAVALTMQMAGYACASNNAVATETSVEVIQVTAQKRSQAISDVPLTITAYDGEFLEEIGITELDALSEITPGLVIQEQSPNNPGFVIRGITSDSGSAQSAPRVSVYYNGADVSRSRGSYFELYDIERVEVVKGPQATLFGTAASVGAISVITNRPEQEFSAGLSLGLGNYNANLARGYVTGGNEKVQGRFAFSYRARDGFIDNIAGQDGSQSAGGLRQDDMHGIERTAFRPSLRLTPNDDLTIDLIYSYEKNNDSGTSFKNGIYAPTGGDTSPFSFVEMSGSPVSEEVLGAEKLGVDRTVEDFNVTLDYQISDSLSMTSISAWRNFESLEIFDADGTQAWFLEFAEDAQGDQFSQEVRFLYENDTSIVIGGLNYFTEDGSQAVPFSTEESIYLNCLGFLGTGLPCINADGSVNVITPLLGLGVSTLPYQAEFINYGDNTTLSAFADFTYLYSDDLEVTFGLRYVSEDKTSGYASQSPNSILSGGPLLPVVSTDGEVLEADASFDDWLPRFNVRYVLNDQTNLYATVAKGRRSEVLNVSSTLDGTGVVADVTEVDAEIVWNYEAGIKGTALDSAMSYAVSAFYQDYSDFQVTLQDDAGDFFTANAGSATNVGVEAEMSYVINEYLDTFANAAFIDAEIDDDAGNGDLAGNKFRLQPEWTYSLGARYEQAVSAELDVFSSLLVTYRSEVFFEPENQPIAGLDISQESVTLTNLRFGVGSNDDAWSLTLYVNNLLDEEYLVDAGNTGGSFGNPTFVAGAPRFYGLELNLSF